MLPTYSISKDILFILTECLNENNKVIVDSKVALIEPEHEIFMHYWTLEEGHSTTHDTALNKYDGSSGRFFWFTSRMHLSRLHPKLAIIWEEQESRQRHRMNNIRLPYGDESPSEVMY